MELMLTKHWGEPGCHTLKAYLAQGGYESLKKALGMSPAEITGEVKKSLLRGRGGARFPTGVKWGFVPKNAGKPVYLVVNGDEGEPGTFKDRWILENSPHAMLEGIAIAAWAIGARECFIYIRGEYAEQMVRVGEAIAEAERGGFLGNGVLGKNFSVHVTVASGAGAYICGEEMGLISSLEGKKGQPRIKPPFPAISGLYQCPTIVNNVETLAYLPYIIRMGGDAFAALGSPKNGGLALYCVSGHVKQPRVLELPMGTPLREIIYTHCGGIRGDRDLKAVIPGGSSAPVLTPDQIDVKMDAESLLALNSMIGSAGVVVMDATTCMVEVARTIADFYAHESCGQCTPCREGTYWIAKLIRGIERGQGQPSDLDKIIDICDKMVGKTVCVFADGAAMPIVALVKKFRHEFEEHLEGRCCVGKFRGGEL